MASVDGHMISFEVVYWQVGLAGCAIMRVQSPMLVRGGANAMMTPERIQSITISYD